MSFERQAAFANLILSSKVPLTIGASNTMYLTYFQSSQSCSRWIVIVTHLWNSSRPVHISPSSAMFGIFAIHSFGALIFTPFLVNNWVPLQKHRTPSSFSDMSQPLGSCVSGSYVYASITAIDLLLQFSNVLDLALISRFFILDLCCDHVIYT